MITVDLREASALEVSSRLHDLCLEFVVSAMDFFSMEGFKDQIQVAMAPLCRL